MACGGSRSWLIRALPFGGVLALGIGPGCGANDGETCEIATDEISTVALVIDSGLDIRAAVDFEQGDRRGRGAPLRLCDTDLLTINGDTPAAIEKASRVEYSVTLPSDGDRRFDFVLERESETITFAIDLPSAFEILAPMDGDELQIGQAQPIEWEPPVDDQSTIQIGLSEALGGGQCLETTEPEAAYEGLGGVPVPDTGQWEVKADELRSDSPSACAATYTLTRLALGDYPAQFERGGRVEARVERYRQIQIVP